MSPKDSEGEHRERIRAVRESLAAGLIGHETLIERLLIACLSGGHVLIEGAPGLAKTRAVNWLARAVDGSFARIQCTPDLMPADLTGTPVFRPDRGDFEFVRGPVFHNVVLVDEINRAPPKVQSALLEAMAEGQVTSGGDTHKLPDPFLAVATQNPIEHEGTYPLPEAQLDRFLFHVELTLPGAADERRILDLVEAESTHEPVVQGIGIDVLKAARRDAMSVHLSPVLRDFIVRLVMATREPSLADKVAYAVSPRGSLALAAAAKARAWLDGRDYATPGDVQALAGDALAHRLVLTWSARADGETARALIAGVLDRTRGQGQDIADIRAYVPGDDARAVDRNVTARTGTLHVRTHHADRDRTVLLVADFRPSMLWGVQRAFRSVAAAEILTLIGWRAIDAGARVGAVILCAADNVVVRARTRPHAMLNVIGAFVRAHEAALSGARDGLGDPPLDAALERVLRVAGRRAEVCLATGFDTPGDVLDIRLAELADRCELRRIPIGDGVRHGLPGGTYRLATAAGRTITARVGPGDAETEGGGAMIDPGLEPARALQLLDGRDGGW